MKCNRIAICENRLDRDNKAKKIPAVNRNLFYFSITNSYRDLPI